MILFLQVALENEIVRIICLVHIIRTQIHVQTSTCPDLRYRINVPLGMMQFAEPASTGDDFIN